MDQDRLTTPEERGQFARRVGDRQLAGVSVDVVLNGGELVDYVIE